MFNRSIRYCPFGMQQFSKASPVLFSFLGIQRRKLAGWVPFCAPYWLVTARHSLTEHLCCVNNHARSVEVNIKVNLFSVFAQSSTHGHCRYSHQHWCAYIFSTPLNAGVHTEVEMNTAISPNHGSWLMLGPTLKTSALAWLWFEWVKSLQLSLKSRCYSTL